MKYFGVSILQTLKPLFHAIRSDVILTGQVVDFWKSLDQADVLSSYVATPSGVVRVYPGVRLSSDLLLDIKFLYM